MENNTTPSSCCRINHPVFTLGCRIIFGFILAWLSVSAMTTTAYADTFEDGMAAFGAREYQKALSLWLSLAEQGDELSQINAGEMYAKGLGVTRDVPEAIKWFNRAAAQGNAAAEFSLGEIYGYDHGVQADHKQSVKWYRKAAQQGHASAQYKLGAKYFKGEGMPMDYLMAYAWMDMAAKQGLDIASNYRDLIASILKPDELKKAKTFASQLASQSNNN